MRECWLSLVTFHVRGNCCGRFSSVTLLISELGRAYGRAGIRKVSGPCRLLGAVLARRLCPINRDSSATNRVPCSPLFSGA